MRCSAPHTVSLRLPPRALLAERLLACQTEGEWLQMVAKAEAVGWLKSVSVTLPTTGPASHG